MIFEQAQSALGVLFRNLTLVIDEAHHVLNYEAEADGGVPERVANRLGQLVHIMVNKRPASARLWLVTATPFRGDGLSMLPAADKACFMQETMTFEEYWREQMTHVKSYSYDFATYKPGQSHQVFRHLLKRVGKVPIIVFCGDSRHETTNGCKLNNVNALIEIAKKAWGRGIECLDLVTDDARREIRKQRLISGKKDGADYKPDIIFTIRMLDEGVDFPPASCAIDFAPLQSLPVLYQRFGRLTRNLPGKKHLQYFTLLSAPGGKEDRETQLLMFNQNLACLHGAMMLEDLTEPKPWSGKKGTGGKRHGWLAEAFPDANRERAVRTKAWVELTKAYAEAKETGQTLTNETGQELVRGILKDEGIKENLTEVTESLLKSCRYLALRGRFKGLGGDRAAAIAAAGQDHYSLHEEMAAGWWYTSGICGRATLKGWKDAWKTEDERTWMEKFEELKDFLAQNGHLNVPYPSPLNAWANKQRSTRVRKIAIRLFPHRIQLLNSIGFPQDPRDDAWTAMFQQCNQLHVDTKNCNVKLGGKSGETTRLAAWQQQQRTYYRQGKLNALRVRKLESIGFCWSKHVDLWEKRFSELIDFKTTNGHCNVPLRSGPLGWWVVKQRMDYKKRHIDSNRQQRLESIGFIWSTGHLNKHYNLRKRVGSLHDFAKNIRVCQITASTQYGELLESDKSPKCFPRHPYLHFIDWPGWPAIWKMAYGSSGHKLKK
jgi:hypothetical protein